MKDTEHWQSLNPPLSPNSEEVDIYRRQIEDLRPVCLLGMTKQLLSLCDYMVDINPIEQEKPVVNSNWEDFEGVAKVIIGDGVLNLAGMDLVPKLIAKRDLIVCRVFMKKFEGMKYATHFPTEFPGSSKIIITQPDIAIVVWDNR
jgi:hypothetical protein